MDQLSKYDKDGYLILKNFLSVSEKRLIIKAFFKVLSKYLKIGNNSLNFYLNNIAFHKKLINFRKKNPKKFSAFYDELSLNASLRSIFYSKKFIKIFTKVLRIERESLYVNGFQFRLDGPFDKRNVVDWHLDGSYYEQTHPYYNAGVCWVALTNNSSKNGTVKFIPKSHKLNLSKKKLKITRKDKISTINFKIPVNKKEKKLIQDLDISFGDVGIFHIHLKHRSGENTSEKFRCTHMCRFHDASKKFNVGKERYIYNKTNAVYLSDNLKRRESIFKEIL